MEERSLLGLSCIESSSRFVDCSQLLVSRCEFSESLPFSFTLLTLESSFSPDQWNCLLESLAHLQRSLFVTRQRWPRPLHHLGNPIFVRLCLSHLLQFSSSQVQSHQLCSCRTGNHNHWSKLLGRHPRSRSLVDSEATSQSHQVLTFRIWSFDCSYLLLRIPTHS